MAFGPGPSAMEGTGASGGTDRRHRQHAVGLRLNLGEICPHTGRWEPTDGTDARSQTRSRPAAAPGTRVEQERRGQPVRFQETLRRLAMIDEGFVTSEARLGLDPAATSALDARTAALLQVGACVAIGSPPMFLEWSTSRALAAGASEDEIADVLLAIAPVAGLGRIVCAAPEVAAALGYDIEAALEESG